MAFFARARTVRELRRDLETLKEHVELHVRDLRLELDELRTHLGMEPKDRSPLDLP
jgi:regulator of replication initiation timing